jgi:cytochrome c-type biogenesis protein CcsB|nr:cytochrome c heme attachment protein [Chlorella variabilis]
MIINIPRIENLCINTCFTVLFFTTVYYWVTISFAQNSSYRKTGLFGYACALLCLTTHLILRWSDSGHFPLSNLYESLIFLGWCLILFHIYIETSMKTLLVGVLTAPAIFCLIAFTDFSLPPDLQKSSPLVPALQSNWLVMHVTVMIASYAALLLGCLVGMAYLLFSKVFSDSISTNLAVTTRNASLTNETNLPIEIKNILFAANTGATVEVDNIDRKSVNLPNVENSKKVLLFLDNLSYRTIGIGFCFLTLGILSGAVWANETWGNYWSWDPKETWAFITWLTFASYLHSRFIGGWSGSKPAWIASFGFVIVWICYLGVNLLGQGLHSYGFLAG